METLDRFTNFYSVTIFFRHLKTEIKGYWEYRCVPCTISHLKKSLSLLHEYRIYSNSSLGDYCFLGHNETKFFMNFREYHILLQFISSIPLIIVLRLILVFDKDI